jgi:two-component system NarL family response regulator
MREFDATAVAGATTPEQLLRSNPSSSFESQTVVTATQIRVMIVDDHELIRSGLAELLGREPNVTVVGCAASGEEALTMFSEHTPDVTLVDMRMTPMDGVEVITRVREIDPAARLIMLTNYDTDEDVYRGLRAGAASYLRKDVGLEELVSTVRAVHGGEKRIPPTIAAKLAEHMATPELTPRQLDTLKLIVEGLSNQAIATKLHVTEGTVKAHVKAILAKFGARDRAHAASIALRRGIVRNS